MYARRSVISLHAISVLSLSACGNRSAPASSASAGFSVVDQGKLTACSDTPYKPFEYEQGGAYTGFDVELMTAIASKLNLSLVVKDTGFDGLQSGAALAAGQCDVAMSALTITPERQKNLSFSGPYYDSKQSLLVSAKSGVSTFQDLVGRKLGIQQGSTGAKYAQDNAPKGVELVSFPSDAEIYPALQAGTVDAVLQDLPINLEHTANGSFTIAQQFDTGEQYGFAVKKTGNESLLAAINDQLRALKSDGEYKKLYDKYFGVQ